MLRKSTFFLMAAASLLALAFYFSARQSAAGTTEMLDTAAMLPDSDVVMTMDFDRTFNIAATSLLSQDAKKIEHLKSLMKTIENQIGISPYEIRQIAAGVKLPPANSTDFFNDAEFTAIVRTANSNANLLDDWSRRIDAIVKFKEEQTPSREYMDKFKVFRTAEFDPNAAEKLSEATGQFQILLKKSQDISAKLNSLPKLAAAAETVSNLKTKNQAIAEDLNVFLSILKSDTDMKNLRETSIKLQNRWNAVTIDDAQRTAKLDAIARESKNILPAYEKKYENAKKLEMMLAEMKPAAEPGEMSPYSNLHEAAASELDKTLASLEKLPATKAAKTEELNNLAGNLESLHSQMQSRFDAMSFQMDMEPRTPEFTALPKPKTPSFNEMLKKSERRETVNGKQMIIIDPEKFDEPSDEKSSIKEVAVKGNTPNLAIGFLDDKTMVIGFERTVAPFLKREAGYKNQKVLEMLGTAQNSLFAFAVNSTATKQMSQQLAKSAEKTAAPKLSESSMFDNLTKDISIYGSINFDGDKTTNDITMSLGFYKEIVGNLPLPEVDKAGAEKNPEVDNTFEFAGYQVGKDIFYDLFNSFKAVQASMTFKFEKKKIAALVRSAPKVIERITAKNSAPAKKEIAKIPAAKPNKLESIADLMTAPQFYVDLAGLLTKNSEK